MADIGEVMQVAIGADMDVEAGTVEGEGAVEVVTVEGEGVVTVEAGVGIMGRTRTPLVVAVRRTGAGSN